MGTAQDYAFLRQELEDVKEILREIADLLKARVPMPKDGPEERSHQLTIPTMTGSSICSVCGIDFTAINGYVCSSPRCPTGVSFTATKVGK